MALEACLDLFEELFSNGHAFQIDPVHQVNNGLDPIPCHGACPMEHALNRIEQCPVPVHLQNAPASLDGIVLAVIGRIVGQDNLQTSARGKLNHSLDELGSRTGNIGPIVEVNHELTDLGIALPVRIPPVLQAWF